MISPTQLNLTMYQGASFTYTFTWTTDGEPVNLSGYTARMDVRPSAKSDDAVFEFVDGDGLALGGEAGTITISVNAEDSAAAPSGQYVYDLLLDSGGEVTRLVEGVFVIEAGVTK